MPTIISGTSGVNLVNDASITTAKLVDNAVTPAKTQLGSLPSMIRLNTANGYGSTNTMIRRFTNVVTNQGTDITYADSATLGGSFTVNVSGVYGISYSDQFSVSAWMGLSLNAAGTTAVTSLTASEIFCAVVTTGAHWAQLAAITIYLPAGSIIRAHTNGNVSGTSIVTCIFTITRVA